MKTQEQRLYGCVVESVKRVLGDGAEILPRSKLVEDLGADSLELMELARELESALGRDLELEEAVQWVISQCGSGPRDISLEQLVDYLIETSPCRWRETG